MTSQFANMTSSLFFGRCLVSLIKFSYKWKFHVKISTCYGVLAIFVYTELTRNGKYPCLSFSTNFSSEKLLTTAKYQDYSFYQFWVIKEKPTGGKFPLPHTDTPTLGLRTKYLLKVVMQIEKALTNDLLRVSKVSWKFCIPTIYNFAIIYPWNLLFC